MKSNFAREAAARTRSNVYLARQLGHQNVGKASTVARAVYMCW